MHLRLHVTIALASVASLAGAAFADSDVPTEVWLREGANLSVSASRDGSSIVFGLVGRAWSMNPQDGFAKQISGDDELGRLFIRFVMESESGRYGPAFLNERYLRLEEQHLGRTLRRLRTELQEEGAGADVESRLIHYERLQHDVEIQIEDLPEKVRKYRGQ